MKKKVRVLIIGINSFLGSNIKKKFSKKFSIIGTSRKKKLSAKTKHLNLKKPKLDFIKKSNYDVIIICAGKNNLEFCQKNYREAYRINFLGIKKILKKAIFQKIFIIFISSNLVFNGNKKFYKVTDKPSPKSNYGKLKLKIENYLKKSKKDKYCILRLTKVYSLNEVFLKKWKIKKKLNESITLDNNFKISPISINIVLRFIYKIIIKKLHGIFHVGDKREFTLGEFFIKKLGKYEKIIYRKNNHKWKNKYNSLKSNYI